MVGGDDALIVWCNYRRGLKAGFMLVPLFGLQLLLTIYRPDLGMKAERHLEYVAFAITNSQVRSSLTELQVRSWVL